MNLVLVELMKKAFVKLGMTETEAKNAARTITLGLTAVTFGKAVVVTELISWALEEGFYELAGELQSELFDLVEEGVDDLTSEVLDELLEREGGALALLAAVDKADGYLLCDECVDEGDAVEDWRVTAAGNLKCRGDCGGHYKNDFYQCRRCDGTVFRRTKKWNYRCMGCEKKVPAT